MFFSNRNRKIGIHIAPKYIAISENVGKSNGSPHFNERRYGIENDDCSLTALLKSDSVIMDVSKYTADKIGKDYADVYISLAEPYLDVKILTVDRHPKKTKNFYQYLRWKLKNEYYMDSDDMYLTYQIMGFENGTYSILVQLCDKKLVQVLNDAFVSQSIPIKIIDSSYNYIHNYLISILEKGTYFILHLDGYLLFSSVNEDMWPQQIRAICLTSQDFDDEGWKSILDKFYSNVARTIYLDIKREHVEKPDHPVIHLVGNINAEYHHGWNNYFTAKRMSSIEFMNREDYRYLFNSDGYLAIERLVAVCQR